MGKTAAASHPFRYAGYGVADGAVVAWFSGAVVVVPSGAVVLLSKVGGMVALTPGVSVICGMAEVTIGVGECVTAGVFVLSQPAASKPIVNIKTKIILFISSPFEIYCNEFFIIYG